MDKFIDKLELNVWSNTHDIRKIVWYYYDFRFDRHVYLSQFSPEALFTILQDKTMFERCLEENILGSKETKVFLFWKHLMKQNLKPWIEKISRNWLNGFIS